MAQPILADLMVPGTWVRCSWIGAAAVPPLLSGRYARTLPEAPLTAGGKTYYGLAVHVWEVDTVRVDLMERQIWRVSPAAAARLGYATTHESEAGIFQAASGLRNAMGTLQLALGSLPALTYTQVMEKRHSLWYSLNVNGALSVFKLKPTDVSDHDYGAIAAAWDAALGAAEVLEKKERELFGDD